MITNLLRLTVRLDPISIAGTRGDGHYFSFVVFLQFLCLHSIDVDTNTVKLIDEAVKVLINLRTLAVKISQVMNGQTLSTLVLLFHFVPAYVEVNGRIPSILFRIRLPRKYQASCIPQFR